MLPPGHGLESAVGPDGVEVAEDEEGFPCGRFRISSPEAKFVDVAEAFLAMTLDTGSEGGGPAGGELLRGVNCGGIFTWTLDKNELPKVLEEPREFRLGTGEDVRRGYRHVFDNRGFISLV
jgi:hypothetical protein